ncbi:hypothetical protein GCK72_025705 [Caenorhabditis remanei]|uniref:Uncharacterized protein n=1 Tax=Caenorhabditis remanei TaxID=31234 RepID=A0A6A5G2R2_CAERE|nr:hypothetical protein GCK72_025705 [Caenorhabditis remanei]KAF1749238.1 hypothetical protein GCK72_025705 [Caenorhabditis remanei]
MSMELADSRKKRKSRFDQKPECSSECSCYVSPPKLLCLSPTFSKAPSTSLSDTPFYPKSISGNGPEKRNVEVNTIVNLNELLTPRICLLLESMRNSHVPDYLREHLLTPESPPTEEGVNQHIDVCPEENVADEETIALYTATREEKYEETDEQVIFAAWIEFCETMRARGLPPTAIRNHNYKKFMRGPPIVKKTNMYRNPGGCKRCRYRNMQQYGNNFSERSEDDIWKSCTVRYTMECHRNQSVIDDLFRKRPDLCTFCKFKLNDPFLRKKESQDHVDSHVKEGLKDIPGKMKWQDEESRKTHREWYPSTEEWLVKKKVPETVENSEEADQVTDVMTNGLQRRKCQVCREQLEEYYDNEWETWRFKNSVGINRKVIHKHCLGDLEQSESNLKEELTTTFSKEEIICIKID